MHHRTMAWRVSIIAWVMAAAGCQVILGIDPIDKSGADGDAQPQSDARADAVCDPGIADLVACSEFEGDADDQSGNGNHGVTGEVSYEPGVHGRAMRTGDASTIVIAESASLDIAAMTMEAWIKPIVPASGRSGIFDNNFQYGLYLHPGGRLKCDISNLYSHAVDGVVANDEWSHVACSYRDGVIDLYVNGELVGSRPGGPALPQDGVDGSTIAGDSPSGDPLIGLIDDLRVWRIARAPDPL